MPIGLYRGLSDHDLTAIVTYLRTVPPIRNAVAQHSTYPFPVELYGPPIAHVADPPDDPVARGAYIEGPSAYCMECHTPALTAVRRDWPRMGAGGKPFEGPRGIVVAPNITSDREHGGIGDWTDGQKHVALTRGSCRRWPPSAAADGCSRTDLSAHHRERHARPHRLPQVASRAVAKDIVRPASEPLVWPPTSQITAGGYVSGGKPAPIGFPSRGRWSKDRTQRQSFGSKFIYGGASSNWFSTTSTVAILGVAPGGFVSSAEPAMMTTKAASPARAFIVTPYADGWHRKTLTRATVAV